MLLLITGVKPYRVCLMLLPLWKVGVLTATLLFTRFNVGLCDQNIWLVQNAASVSTRM